MEKSICGKSIYSAVVRRHDLRVMVPDDFANRMCGKFIKKLDRRGKYIIFEFANEPNEVAILHLGMSGRVHIYDPNQASLYRPRKHDHIILDMEDGTRLVYEDPRRFGMFCLYKVNERGIGWGDIPPFDTMGPEPLSDTWDGGVLHNIIRERRAPIKSLLLDQRIVAGLGNIYVCEALYTVGINPKQWGKDLAEAKCVELVSAVKEVLLRAIKAGGSTLRDYQKTDGSLGYFQNSFHVYGREGEPCMKSGCEGVIVRISQGGRSTFYCSVCQK
jgi:formamidopyrimidine-DNA glycosylase